MKKNVRRYLSLFSVTMILSVIWLAVLPWLAAQPAMEQRLRFFNDQGIDPSAMYYTELEAMKPIRDRMNVR